MSAATEIVRGENGLVDALQDGAHRRQVVRDTKGRITAITGPRPVDHLVHQLAQTERTLTQQIAETASQQARALEQTALRLEGWHPVGGTGLLIHAANVERAVQWLGITWPKVDVDWMSDADEAAWDRSARDQYGDGARVYGYRAPSIDASHRIVLRVGAGAASTSRTLIHELGHCRQCELFAASFDAMYSTTFWREVLERHADTWATVVTDRLELFRDR